MSHSGYSDDVCIICGKLLARHHKHNLCAKHLKEKQDKDKIEKWLNTGDTNCGVSTTLRNCIRDYILKQQNFCCAICNISNQWNGKELKFILDHINGDASNNYPYNLRLICPNCDSQLDTYKSKNKFSARTHRQKI